MDFFDELGKKVTETYQEVKEKATNYSEELKLKSKINNLKERKTTLYTEIGEIVYINVKDNKDVDRDVITEKCNEVTKLLEEVSKLETEILSFKNMKVCVACGKKIDDEHKFCPHCGKEQPEVKKEEPAHQESEGNPEDHENYDDQNNGENNG